MRVLLLSANTGGGHNTAAAAILDELNKRGIWCEQKDALAFVSDIHSDIISSGHSYIYRHLPQLFGVGYRFEEKHPPRFIYEQMALGAKRFADYLKANPVDAIISTHIFGSMLVTESRYKYGVSVPHYAVITDYAVYPGYDMVDVACFFVPNKEIAELYVNAGVSPHRVIASGIPISTSFTKRKDKLSVREKLHLPTKGRIVLMFSGSIGCGRMDRIAKDLENTLPEDATLVIICGHNSRLVKKLKSVCTDKSVIIGYTTRVSDYMFAADLCISKPGGLSVTEMMVTGLPMILMLSVPGCETHNFDFFISHQAAVGTDDWDVAIKLTENLLHSDNQITQMKENLLKIDYPGGASIIADVVSENIVE